jgi:hypothetical protein
MTIDEFTPCNVVFNYLFLIKQRNKIINKNIYAFSGPKYSCSKTPCQSVSEFVYIETKWQVSLNKKYNFI